MQERHQFPEPINHEPKTKERYRQLFDALAAEVCLHHAEHYRQNEDGTTTRVTSYQSFATEENIKQTAALRVLGVLAGLKEAVPPFVAGFRSQDDFPSYTFVHLTYEETLPGPGTGRSDSETFP
ncbi:hypothetical protein [Kitasatospora sp. NPDC005856]|uniref:hypothetical protein n=1 Tax=Kitasatospora sp. NPDC005856 TaxID=3154566 RepID=UPI00340D767E